MTPDQEAKEREAFEAWHRTRLSGLALSRCNAPGDDLSEYQNGNTNGQWRSWLARAESALLAEAVAEAYDAWISLDLNADTEESEYTRLEARLDQARAVWRKGRR